MHALAPRVCCGCACHTDELDERLRLLEAERLRPVPPPPWRPQLVDISGDDL